MFVPRTLVNMSVMRGWLTVWLVVMGLTLQHVNSKECTISSWSPWSECTPLRDCSASRMRVSTVAMNTNRFKMASPAMKGGMAEKDSTWRDMNTCRESGTCPKDFMRPSTGPKKCVDGVAGDLPCWNIELKSFININDLGYASPTSDDEWVIGNDCWGWTDPDTRDEYAIIGLSGGTSFVRITDPENPVPVGFIYTQTFASKWRDIKVVNDHAFIVSEAADHGIQVFDLTLLRCVTKLTYFNATCHYAGFGHAHNIISNPETGFVYGCGAGNKYRIKNYLNYTQLCNDGLHAVDVSDPLQPKFAGCYSQDGYTHDAQCVVYGGPDRHYQGKEVCFNYNENSLTIVDVSDKSEMRLISKRGYTSSVYTHQGWLTEDHSTIVMDDELDEMYSRDRHTKTFVWDVSDLDSPKLMSIYRHATTVIDHNQYVKDHYTYQANYEGGLRILHIDQQNYELHEVGYFDVYPSDDLAVFKGSWSVYPYFSSGNVIVSSIDYGLFILRPDYDALQTESEADYVHSERTRTRSVTSSVTEATCPPLRESQMCASVRC